MDVVFASLKTLPENEAIALLHNLRSDASPGTLAVPWRSDVSQTADVDIAQQLSFTPHSTGLDSSSMASSRQQSIDESVQFAETAIAVRSTFWFRVPQDGGFVEHLLNLYFCWIHPFHQLLEREHFLYDMARGRTQFCSAILVNAILSVACLYSDRTLARVDPDEPASAGRWFCEEAKRLLDSTDKSCLTTVQALGIMGMREILLGRDGPAYHYLGRCVLMAVEMGLHLSIVGVGLLPSEVEVRKITFWGIFNFETSLRSPSPEYAYSVGLEQVPQLRRAAADIQKPGESDGTGVHMWQYCNDSMLSRDPSLEQPDQLLLFSRQLSSLSKLASNSINNIFAPQERISNGSLTTAYMQYQAWYQDLENAFPLEKTSPPHVIVLHMYYHACVLHLVRPYLSLDLQGPNFILRDTCIYCADKISELMGNFRTVYGLRRVCHVAVGTLLSASIIHLSNSPSDQSVAHLHQGLHDFESMSLNHPIAARSLEIVRVLASKWNIPLPEGTVAVVPVGESYWSSQSASTLWQTSIQPTESSQCRTSSSGSTGSHHEPPFQNLVSLPKEHALNSPAHTDPTIPLECTLTPDAFWTPFPARVGPLSSRKIGPSMPVDFVSHTEGQMTPWDMFDGSVADLALNVDSNPYQHAMPLNIGETMKFEGVALATELSSS